MDLKAIWAVLARRWYLLILVIGCTVGATFFVTTKVGPTYEAQGAVLVFPPVATVQRGAEQVTQGNPYLALDGVSQARDIVIRELTSKSTADDFETTFPGSTYEATPDVLNNAPIILITVESAGEGSSIDGVTNLTARIPTTLTALQSGLGLDANSVITSRNLTLDNRPDVLHKDQIRAAVVAAVVTFGLGLLAIGLLDGLLTSQRTKRNSVNLPESPTATNGAVLPAALAHSFVGDPIAHVAPQRGEKEKTVKPAGVAATRLRPRSPAPSAAAAVATDHPNGSPRGEIPQGRSSRSGSRSMADPAQRR